MNDAERTPKTRARSEAQNYSQDCTERGFITCRVSHYCIYRDSKTGRKPIKDTFNKEKHFQKTTRLVSNWIDRLGITNASSNSHSPIPEQATSLNNTVTHESDLEAENVEADGFDSSITGAKPECDEDLDSKDEQADPKDDGARALSLWAAPKAVNELDSKPDDLSCSIQQVQFSPVDAPVHTAPVDTAPVDASQKSGHITYTVLIDLH